ncbi:MAG: trigger factor [Lachnospiraceae bacterium]|nr:trigger factor [Lachnospiraceae bacterium]
MKKGLRVMAAGLCAMLLLAGCGNKAESDYSKYVTLGQYKGVEITAVPDVTEEELEAEVASRFRDTVADGDTVNIDYVGTKDGVAFDGGTAQGQSLTIGSNTYIDGFEEGLVGVKVGDTVDLNLTFPDPYKNNPDLAGKPVVFTVTVNSISGVVGAELTEEVIAANTMYDSVDAYRESVREELQLVKDNQKLTQIWAIVQETTTISGYPKKEVEEYANDMKSYYESMASMYGTDLATLLSASGMTEETFNQQCQEYGQEECAKYMILEMIAKEENITVSEEEFNEEIAKAVTESGMEKETLLEYYGGEELVRENLLYNKVLEFLLENAVEV